MRWRTYFDSQVRNCTKTTTNVKSNKKPQCIFKCKMQNQLNYLRWSLPGHCRPPPPSWTSRKTRPSRKFPPRNLTAPERPSPRGRPSQLFGRTWCQNKLAGHRVSKYHKLLSILNSTWTTNTVVRQRNRPERNRPVKQRICSNCGVWEAALEAVKIKKLSMKNVSCEYHTNINMMWS